ncbi:TnpV protein [Ligilactobacillus ruminis]|uniref:TnpV protein n=1 Tax=Ligilactobacillus ruminis TaxID=1623 RepID=UPI0022E50613|nr:TnpV protein [Ligilactobacillus ruminis]
MKQNHKVIYYNLLTEGKLNSYLANIEERARLLFDETVKSLAEKGSVTEELKSTDMMLWVQKMNNIRNRTLEIVNNQIIFK